MFARYWPNEICWKRIWYHWIEAIYWMDWMELGANDGKDNDENWKMKRFTIYKFYILWHWKCRIWCEGWADARSLIRFYVVVLSHAHLVFIQVRFASNQFRYVSENLIFNVCNVQRTPEYCWTWSAASVYVTFERKKLNWTFFGTRGRSATSIFTWK